MESWELSAKPSKLYSDHSKISGVRVRNSWHIAHDQSMSIEKQRDAGITSWYTLVKRLTFFIIIRGQMMTRFVSGALFTSFVGLLFVGASQPPARPDDKKDPLAAF